MDLVLDLKNKELYEKHDRLFSYTFNSFSYDEKYEIFYLGEDLSVSAKALYEVIFEPSIEEIKFEADYEEDYIDWVDLESSTSYNRELVIKELDYALEIYLTKHPLEKEKGTVKGTAEVYYDYDYREFNIKIKELHLV